MTIGWEKTKKLYVQRPYLTGGAIWGVFVVLRALLCLLELVVFLSGPILWPQAREN